MSLDISTYPSPLRWETEVVAAHENTVPLMLDLEKGCFLSNPVKTQSKHLLLLLALKKEEQVYTILRNVATGMLNRIQHDPFNLEPKTLQQVFQCHLALEERFYQERLRDPLDYLGFALLENRLYSLKKEGGDSVYRFHASGLQTTSPLSHPCALLLEDNDTLLVVPTRLPVAMNVPAHQTLRSIHPAQLAQSAQQLESWMTQTMGHSLPYLLVRLGSLWEPTSHHEHHFADTATQNLVVYVLLLLVLLFSAGLATMNVLLNSRF